MFLSQPSYGGGGASYSELSNYSNHPNPTHTSTQSSSYEYENAGYTQPRAGYAATASQSGFHSAGVDTGFDPNMRSSGQANGSGYGYPVIFRR